MTGYVRRNATLRRVHAVIVALEKQYILHIICAFDLALFIQHAMRMRHIVICDLSSSTILLHII